MRLSRDTELGLAGIPGVASEVSDTEAVARLWETFWSTGDPAVRDELILLHYYLVDIATRRLPSNVVRNWSIDDLRSYGSIGLINAVDRRRSDLAHVPFAPYALCRITGAIYDELRNLDWLPRTLRHRVIEYRKTEDALQSSQNRRPTRVEIYREMELTNQRQISATTLAIGQSQLVSLQDRIGDKDETLRGDRLSAVDDTEQIILAQSDRDELKGAVDDLPERQRTILNYRFHSSLTQRQVAELLGVSSTRVAQIEGQALRVLRQVLGARRTADSR